MERPIDNPNDYEYVFDTWSCRYCCFWDGCDCLCNNDDMISKCSDSDVVYRKKEDSVKE